MLMNNSRCNEEKDHRKPSILHHMVSPHSSDEVNILDLQTCTVSKMLLASTTNVLLQLAGKAKNMGNTIIRITISRGAIIKVSTFETR
jgi:hypothetical protein